MVHGFMELGLQFHNATLSNSDFQLFDNYAANVEYRQVRCHNSLGQIVFK